jgi:hypothetical protein
MIVRKLGPDGSLTHLRTERLRERDEELPVGAAHERLVLAPGADRRSMCLECRDEPRKIRDILCAR